MQKELVVRASVKIKAEAAKVWDALVNPEQTKKYMFGCEAISGWEIGAPLLWKGMADGKEMVYVKGNIVNIEPQKLLKYTTFDPNSGLEDVPSNYVTVTYDLTPENGHTILSVTHGDFSTVENGAKRYEDTMSGGGWEGVLNDIKNLVEE